jgi:hypothetical protein
MLLGGTRQALLRIGNERTSGAYGAQLTEVFLRALGADPRHVSGVLRHELPPLSLDKRKE